MDRREFFKRAAAGSWLAVEAANELERSFKRSLWSGWSPILHGDGIRDDTRALQALFDGKKVWDESRGDWMRPGPGGQIVLHNGVFRVSSTLEVRSDTLIMGNEFRSTASPVIRLEGDRMTMLANHVQETRHRLGSIIEVSGQSKYVQVANNLLRHA